MKRELSAVAATDEPYVTHWTDEDEMAMFITMLVSRGLKMKM